MHYTGMAVASYAALDLNRVMEGSHSTLGYGVALATVLVLGFALLALTPDRRYAAQVPRRVPERGRRFRAPDEGGGAVLMVR